MLYIARYMLSPVRPSHSHDWISQNRLKLELWNIHLTVLSLMFLQDKCQREILTGSPRARPGALNKGGVGNISHFLALNVNMFPNIQSRSVLLELVFISSTITILSSSWRRAVVNIFSTFY